MAHPVRRHAHRRRQRGRSDLGRRCVLVRGGEQQQEVPLMEFDAVAGPVSRQSPAGITQKLTLSLAAKRAAHTPRPSICIQQRTRGRRRPISWASRSLVLDGDEIFMDC